MMCVGGMYTQSLSDVVSDFIVYVCVITHICTWCVYVCMYVHSFYTSKCFISTKGSRYMTRHSYKQVYLFFTV